MSAVRLSELLGLPGPSGFLRGVVAGGRYANAYLFQLAKTGVAKAEIEGLWENAPMPANDLTGVHWKD